MSARARSLLVLLLAAAWPPDAGAGDGVLEIGQACALNTGCFPGDDPGFPVSIGETGSYRLTGALDAGVDVTAVEIAAPDVSLDLNGFSIRGGSICSGDPPTVCTGATGQGVRSTAEGTRVLAGFVSGFADGGVVLADSAHVSGVEARRNGRVGIEVGERGGIRQSHASANAGIGLVAGRDGSVRDCISVHNGGTAVALGFGAGLGNSVLVSEAQAPVTGGVLLGGNACNAEPSCSRVCTDADGDAYFSDCSPLDCDDGESQSFPGNPELCDGIDNDCNGLVDDACGGGGLGEGEVCTPDPDPCAPGLLCCYPCGVPGCEFRCSQPAPGGGCLLPP